MKAAKLEMLVRRKEEKIINVLIILLLNDSSNVIFISAKIGLFFYNTDGGFL